MYTLVTIEYPETRERFEALYYRGELILDDDGGGDGLSGAAVLDAIANSNISVRIENVYLDQKHDEVFANEGWPRYLDEIPIEAQA